LYRPDRFVDYGVFTPLLTKTADLTIVEEQWDEMPRVALSLKQRTALAHVIVQRLTNSSISVDATSSPRGQNPSIWRPLSRY
jgi:TnpA family transposase